MDPSSEDHDAAPDLRELRAVARSRWRRSIAFAGIIAVLGAAVLLAVVGPPRHRSHQHRSTAGEIASVAVALISIAVTVWLLARWRRRGTSLRTVFTPPIQAGLPRNDRRVVSRAIRRGAPSDDPRLRAVETEMAERITRNGRLVRLAYPAFAVVMLLNAIGQTGFLRGLSITLVALVVPSFVVVLVLHARCRRYLRNADAGTR